MKQFIEDIKADWAIKKRYWSLRIQALFAAAAATWTLLPEETKMSIYEAVYDLTGIKPSIFVLLASLGTIFALFYRQKSVADAEFKRTLEEGDATLMTPPRQTDPNKITPL